MKRVLVISNNCFSKSNSNGRTLGNLFLEYEKSKISQLFISGTPDDTYCDNYFQVTDFDVLKSVFPFYKQKKINQEGIQTHRQRNVKNMIIRNILWNCNLWKKKSFKTWLLKVNPEVVVLQVGDCSFFIRLAIHIAKEFNAKLIVYNSEAYYFKKNNYFRDGNDFLYKFFLLNYRKNFDKLMSYADFSIYLNDDLKREYDEKFDKKSYVIFNSYSHFGEAKQFDTIKYFGYFGNLSLGRDDSLCFIADILKEIDSNIKIKIYGAATQTTINKFQMKENIEYMGFVSYSDVSSKMNDVDVLLHVESFDPFYVEDSKFGFSGKIPDSLNSLRPFLVYAPSNISCINYLRNNKIDSIASDEGALKKALYTIINDSDYRRNLVKKQIDLANNNHNPSKNSLLFCNLLNDKEVS